MLLKAVLDRSKKTEMSDYERRYPIHVYDVAAAIRVLLERHFQYQQKTPGNKVRWPEVIDRLDLSKPEGPSNLPLFFF